MPINVYLQTLDGTKKGGVFDLHNSLVNLWPIGDSSFLLLQYIDPYCNVIFNGSQMAEVRKELQRLIQLSKDDVQAVLREIDELAAESQRNPHLFLRFRGD